MSKGKIVNGNPMAQPKDIPEIEILEPLIFTIRGQRVILDADLAFIYEVPTKVFNQAIKRNAERFPEDFAFQLTEEEFRNLRSQFTTSSSQDKADSKAANWSQIVTSSSQVTEITYDSKNSSQFAMSSSRYRGAVYLPWAFTEHGALMAANILRSDRAVQMSVFVVRAFVRLREQITANQAILKRLAEIDRSLLRHDTALRDIYRKLLPLLDPPPLPPKRKIGFLTDEK